MNCEDNTSLGEFTLAPIPPMKAGDAVLEVVFEVDVNGILKVTATEKTSGRSANITISNSVGKLSSSEIESMINGTYQPVPSLIPTILTFKKMPRSSRTPTRLSARSSRPDNSSSHTSRELRRLFPTQQCLSRSSVGPRRRSSPLSAMPWLSSRLRTLPLMT